MVTGDEARDAATGEPLDLVDEAVLYRCLEGTAVVGHDGRACELDQGLLDVDVDAAEHEASRSVPIICVLAVAGGRWYLLGIGDKDKFDRGGIIGGVIVLAVLRIVRRPRDAGPRPAAS